MIVAAIDIGSNAVRLFICSLRTNSDGASFKMVEYVRVPIRLGDYVFINNFIPPKKEQDLVDLMRSFRILMDLFRVDFYRACATSALREAKNAPEILSRVSKEANIEIEVISGSEEAELIFAAHENYIQNYQRALFVDVGGGSTEITYFQNNEKAFSKSFKLGTVRILDNKDDEQTWEQMLTWLKGQVRLQNPEVVIATGGNISKAFNLMHVKNGKTTTFKRLRELYLKLSEYSYRERISHLGLNPDRADVIIPALEIYLAAMKASGTNLILTSGLGLRDGIVAKLYKDNQHLLEKHTSGLKQFSIH